LSAGNYLMFGAVLGLGYLVYSNSSSKDDESGSGDNTLTSANNSFAQTSQKIEFQGDKTWAETFDTSCGFSPTEEGCEEFDYNDCSEDCSRLMKRSKMYEELFNDGLKSECQDCCDRPSMDSLCLLGGDVSVVGKGGHSLRIGITRNNPIMYTDQTGEFYLNLQAFTNCYKKKRALDGWAYSHLGRLDSGSEKGFRDLEFLSVTLSNPDGSVLTEGAGIEVPADDDYQNITNEEDCEGYGYNSSTKCGGFSRFTFKIKPQDMDSPDTITGAFDLSMKVRVLRPEHWTGGCGFDEMYDITVPNVIFILPANCKTDCNTLPSSSDETYTYIGFERAGGQYQLKKKSFWDKVADRFGDIHARNNPPPSSFDTWIPSYMAEEITPPPKAISLISRNSYISY